MIIVIDKLSNTVFQFIGKVIVFWSKTRYQLQISTLHIDKHIQRLYTDLTIARNCGDNAPTESWFNSFKNERVHGLRYETRAEMAAMSFEYIEVLYNRKRQHSTLGYKSPMRFLNDWLITQQKKKLIA